MTITCHCCLSVLCCKGLVSLTLERLLVQVTPLFHYSFSMKLKDYGQGEGKKKQGVSGVMAESESTGWIF